MSLLSLPLSERLEYLQELISCTFKLYYWSYGPDGELLSTSCPDTVLDKVFLAAGGMDTVFEHAADHNGPLVLSSAYGLTWCAAFERDPNGSLLSIHVLGPVLSTELSPDSLRELIQSSKIPSSWRPKFTKILRRIPIVFTSDFMRISLMLQYCVCGEKLTISEIALKETVTKNPEARQAPVKDRTVTYRVEQALMRMVREGDISYKTVLHDAASISRGVRISGMGSLDQIKVTQIVFISLCTRAAIEGGISPLVAYSQGDAYIQDIIDCKSVAKAAEIGHTMFDDFVNRVHKNKINTDLSPQIQRCCEYIELHAEDKISLSDIASHIGYADYYLSRKFKNETGININDYIKKTKIEKAKTLLLASEDSIQEICDRLHFGSRSFFAETFKEITGVSPAAYRESSRKIT